MRQQQTSLIANALGCGLVALLLSGCSILGGSNPQPRVIEISASPVPKPELVLPKADQLFLREVTWTIITTENYEQVFDALKDTGKPVVLFGLTDNGYEALALNLSSLRAFIQQQQVIIAAYENYYKEAQSTIDAANRKLEDAAQEAERANQQHAESRRFFPLR